MIRPGLCSVTFRALPVEEVIALTSDAGLAGIEWGGDVHAPAGDIRAAQRVRELTEDAGLEVLSYGSYLRLTGTDEEHDVEVEAVLASARALGAPRVRIWAGDCGSAEVDEQTRRVLTDRLRALCERAAADGVEIGLEHHRGTLTDDLDSSLRLLRETDHPSLRTYWQPNLGQGTAEAVADLRRLLPQVSTVHVFSWWPWDERIPLAQRSDLWREVLTVLAADGTDHDALLEFVPDDDPRLLPREAETLLALVAEAGAR